jgi:glycosyltransferase involved in cell wall biosynthesis
MRRLTIGIYVALLPPEHNGGAELQADRLARELAARGHAVHFFARRQPGRPGSETRDGVCIHRRLVVPIPGLRPAAEVVLGAWQGRRISPDVFLCYITMNSGLIGAAASALCGAPFVVWQRLQGESVWEASAAERRTAFAVLRRAAGIWVQAPSFAQELRASCERYGEDWERLSGRVRVLGNGVDLPAVGDGAVPPPARVLFVGRLVPQKDVPTLLGAAARVPEIEVWIAGDGPSRRAWQAASPANVRFLGAVPHARIADLLVQCRALVLASHREGLPNVVLEALALGRPVVANPVGAVADIVQDGVNGRVVPVGDEGALAAAMTALLDDSRWGAWARAARPSIAAHAWPALVERVESELAAVAARPVPGSSA